MAVAPFSWLGADVTADSVAAARLDMQRAVGKELGPDGLADCWAGSVLDDGREHYPVPPMSEIIDGITPHIFGGVVALVRAADPSSAAEAAELAVLCSLVRPAHAARLGLASRLLEALSTALDQASGDYSPDTPDATRLAERLAGCLACLVSPAASADYRRTKG